MLRTDIARMYLQLPLRQLDAGNVYLLVLSSWKVNIAENPIVLMGLFGHNLHCWCFIQFLHYRKIHKNMSETFFVFSLTLSPMSTAFYTKEILTCFFLVCHFLPKLLTANIKACYVIESSHIQNEYPYRFGAVLTKRPTLYLVFPVIVIIIVILAMFTF